MISDQELEFFWSVLFQELSSNLYRNVFNDILN